MKVSKKALLQLLSVLADIATITVAVLILIDRLLG